MSWASKQVTRAEIADIVQEAFNSGAPHRADLMAAAVRKRARPHVMVVLRDLPARRFTELRQLWEAMPDVPVE
jgi:hypothetical protein